MKLKALVRAAVRGTQFMLYLSLGVILGIAYRLHYGQHWHLGAAGQAIIRWWMQHMTRIVGIRVTQYGRPLTANVMFVANHISFLDILVISAIVPARFLSKHTVRYWPIIGYLTHLSGTVFIERGKPSQLSRTLDALRQALSSGRPMLIFPEGTTTLGTQVIKFHSGLFQAAIDNMVPVQALTLHYRRNERADRVAAYIDNDNFLLSLLRLMAQDNTEVHISFSPPIDSTDQVRQHLAAQSHATISRSLHAHLHSPSTPHDFDECVELAILGECER
jgi:1-acyl-sn-glycerol-3-phosphate acyltransferase